MDVGLLVSVASACALLSRSLSSLGNLSLELQTICIAVSLHTMEAGTASTLSKAIAP